MWRLGFFFHEIAFGFLSVFIPLYVVGPTIGGTLVDIGIMASLALFLTIPASFFWGYICDKTKRYKPYVLLSFLSIALMLLLFTLTTSVEVFIALYVIMSILHVAHEAPKNILIAENYSREEWERSFALYEGLTEIGFLVGLLIGLFASALSFSANFTLFLCSGLNFTAFFLSIFLVADPLLLFERKLVSIEKKIDFTWRGANAFSHLSDGHSPREKLRGDRFLGFGLGLIFFSLASSIFFTPLPLFFSQQLALPASMVFLVYMLNSSGSMIGYFFIGNRSRSINGKKQLRRMVFLRGFIVFLLVAVVNFAFYPTLISGIILVLLGFAYAVYSILIISLSMELIPTGRTGLIDVLIGIGAAVGSFFGPYLADMFGYLPQFIIAGAVFFLAYFILKFLS